MQAKLKALWTKAMSYLPTARRKIQTSMQIVYVYGTGLIILF